MNVTSIIAGLTAGGIGPVCHYAAQGLARRTDWQVTLLSLHDPVEEWVDAASGLRVVCLGLDGNCARLFLQWLEQNPQDLIITSDVSRIEAAYPYLPESTAHVIQMHDSGRRYRSVAVRHASWIDGVTCVGKHIEAPLRRELGHTSFRGLLRTVHNGADFPVCPTRCPHEGPLRLLFMGRVEALKGVFDFVPLLQRLKRLDVPVVLNIVGGENELLRKRFEKKGVAEMVVWTGRVAHEQCYEIAEDSDVFLMTSRKEPFGMVTIEAMSMGCVPIAYDIPSGSTEIIEHEKNGLLVPLGDFQTWAEHIRSLHLVRKRLSVLSSGAIKRARGTFNVESMTSNMVTFLSDVLDHTGIESARRQVGSPAETPAVYQKPRRGYQFIPAGLRDWIRNRVFASPKLSHWLLNR